jgi:predicted amidophosphoribosyltransferase
LALALVKEGFGQRVVELLTRRESVEKASTGGKRNAHSQRDSLSVAERIPPAAPIVLVDDILTTGSQMMGAALALGATMPGLEIACFAAMRTISDIADFQRLHAPVSGNIKLLEGGACRRRP